MAAAAPVAATASSTPAIRYEAAAVTDFETEAQELPAELAAAIARDLDTTPEDYLARADAAVQAVEVVEKLEETGVDVLASRLDGTDLVVNVSDEIDAATVAETGASAEVGLPVARDWSALQLQPLADLVGGQGFLFTTREGTQRLTNVCSVAFNGTDTSTGSAQFLTAGHCIAPGRQDGGGYFEATQTAPGTYPTRGPLVGQPIESSFRFGGGADVGVVATDAGANPKPVVSTWGGNRGTASSGTPVAIKSVTAGIKGAPLCKSGRTSGWTCGEILETNYNTPVYNHNGTPQYVNLTLTNVCMLEGDSGSAAMVGSAAFGIGSAGDFGASCSGQTDAVTGFFPLTTTDGTPSVASVRPNWRILTASPWGNDWSPYGAFDSATASVDAVSLSGWAFDPDVTTKATQIHVYQGGYYGSGTFVGSFDASGSRPDVNQVYPNAGANHGFSITFPSRSGTNQYCLHAINVGRGSNVQLGCKTVTTPSNEMGSFDSATGVIGGIQVSGWSLDRRSQASTYVWVNVDGVGGPVLASGRLNWIDAYLPGVGPNHGFTAKLAAAPGPHRVCVTGTKENTSYGCKSVVVPSSGAGSLDAVQGAVGSIRVTGWTVDRLSTQSTYVWINVDGKGKPYLAGNSLGWIDSYFPGVGKRHGFDVNIPAGAGSHQVCAVHTFDNQNLGCKTVTVASAGASSIDSVTGVAGGVNIRGWSVKRGSTDLTYIWVDVDGKGTAVAAGDSLDWIASYFPGVGANHGINATIPASPGAHRICITATLDNVPLGCSNVVVPSK